MPVDFAEAPRHGVFLHPLLGSVSPPFASSLPLHPKVYLPGMLSLLPACLVLNFLLTQKLDDSLSRGNSVSAISRSDLAVRFDTFRRQQCAGMTSLGFVESLNEKGSFSSSIPVQRQSSVFN